MGNVKFRVCGDVKAPKRNYGDAGVDCFVPNASEEFINDIRACNPKLIFGKDVSIYDECMVIEPHVDIKFPLYIQSRVPANYVLLCTNKSGVCTKQKLIVGGDTIDSSYQGIIHAHLFNASNETQQIEFGQKILQIIPIIIDPDEIEVYSEEGISSDEFYKGMLSERGAGGFGSTGLK